MKLQKVLVILGISVFLLTTQMQGTFGIEETETEQEELESEEEPKAAEDTGAEQKSAESRSTETKPAEPEPVISEPAETKPAEPAPAEPESAELDQAEPETAEAETSEENLSQSGALDGMQESAGQKQGEISPEGKDIEENAEDSGDKEEPGGSEDESGKAEIWFGGSEEGPDGSEETDKNEESSGSGENPDGGEETDKNEESGGSGEEPDGSEETDKNEESGGSGEEPDGSEETDKNEESGGSGENPDGSEETDENEASGENGEDIDGISDNAAKTEAGKETGKSTAETPAKKEIVSAGQNSETAGKAVKTEKETNMFENSNAYAAFTPSSEFIDNRKKIKYNVAVPIEGLPSFITQEMVVGALKCQDETGYPASVTIAQIIQESGFGQYGPGGEDGEGLSYLAYQYNNLFGIKGSGTAGSVAMNTGEQRTDGSRYRITAGFRVYNTYTECIEDRTNLLKRVYSDLTFGVKDANTFAMKIGKRWATSLSYGQNLIHQMNQYNLYCLDELTLKEFSGMLGTFANPCPGAELTSGFGYRNAPIAGASTYHKGIDMGTGGYNIPTYAAQAGTVTYAGDCGSAGLMVTIDHGNGTVTKYMHHDKIYVKAGERVEKGQQIGLSGTTGNSTGNHLHFQVEKNGTAVDPMPYLNTLE